MKLIPIFFVSLTALSLFGCASSEPVKRAPTQAELEAQKYPKPPQIFSHTMSQAHSARMAVRYSPRAIFQLEDCEGCVFVYDETTVTDADEISTTQGLGKESRFSESDSILNRFGSFKDGALTTETGWASKSIVKFCYVGSPGTELEFAL